MQGEPVPWGSAGACAILEACSVRASLIRCLLHARWAAPSRRGSWQCTESCNDFAGKPRSANKAARKENFASGVKMPRAACAGVGGESAPRPGPSASKRAREPREIGEFPFAIWKMVCRREVERLKQTCALRNLNETESRARTPGN